MIGSILSALGGLFAAFKALFGWIERKEQRRVGRLEASVEAYKRETGRARKMREIQKETAGLSADELDRWMQSYPERPPAGNP